MSDLFIDKEEALKKNFELIKNMIRPANLFNADQQLCACGKESDIATHCIENEEVKNKYYCKDCYNEKD